MKPKHRMHSLARWPKDVFKRLVLSQTDIDFCKTIARITGSSDGLQRTLDEALRIRSDAVKELGLRNPPLRHP